MIASPPMVGLGTAKISLGDIENHPLKISPIRRLSEYLIVALNNLLKD